LQLPTSPQPPQVSALIEEGLCIITFGDTDHQLKIPQNHRIHFRSVQTVSSILEISAAHSRELSKKLLNNDVAEVLIAQRKGQKQDILVDSSVKAELIQ